MRSATKRSLDLVTSALALILLSLPFAVIALAIKLDDCSPVFFRQVRIGRGGKPFRVWKFRTMSVMEVSPKAPDLLSRDDPRITRVGQRLRNLGLDKLPQFLNVLTGEMSLVGPRPTLAYQVEHYDATQRRRLEVRPALRVSRWCQAATRSRGRSGSSSTSGTSITGRSASASWPRRFGAC